jgi:uracil-DNA glycosylase
MTRILADDDRMKLEEINSQVVSCIKCRLSESRTKAVPGSGSYTAEIMFVGEGPGKNEDLQGLPFVGAAGKFLDKLLESINIFRKDVYITNVVKCRPPNNRDPFQDEIEACLPYLRMQTNLIKPKVICTLGNAASRTLVKSDISISKTHGKFYRKKGIIFCTLYHPAAALYNQSLKDVLQEDFLKLGVFLENKMDMMKDKIEIEKLEDESAEKLT